VVLAGQPNVGKSSLLNALAGAELAIVTPIPGTTRDRVSETIQIEGVPLHVIDTAGLRADHEAGDEVERIGIGRSWEAIAEADAVLFLHDLTRAGEPAYEAAEQAHRRAAAARVPLLQVFNKATRHRPQILPRRRIGVSARTGDGLDRAAPRAAATAPAGRPATKGCTSPARAI
jgi:tRNA modification GTPase